jgi:hypothetical protein
MAAGPVKLTPGYVHLNRGTAAYMGVLRLQASRARPAWTCGHSHGVPVAARRCAEAELERREQGSREVFTLRRCEPCDRWWPDGDGALCPHCGVPAARLRLVALERVLDPGNRRH